MFSKYTRCYHTCTLFVCDRFYCGLKRRESSGLMIKIFSFLHNIKQDIARQSTGYVLLLYLKKCYMISACDYMNAREKFKTVEHI